MSRDRGPLPALVEVVDHASGARTLRFDNLVSMRLDVADAERAATDPTFALWVLQGAAGYRTDERVALP